MSHVSPVNPSLGMRILLSCPRLVREMGVRRPGLGAIAIWEVMILCIMTAFCAVRLSLRGVSFRFSRMVVALESLLKSWTILRAALR